MVFSPRFEDAEDLRNDVAGALQFHRVADADVLAGDFVFVVQGGVLHEHAADIDRGEAGAGGERAGAADLDFDIFEQRAGAFGGEFPGGGPARRAAGEAEAGLQCEVVDFVDDAVDVVGQVGALQADVGLEFFCCRFRGFFRRAG